MNETGSGFAAAFFQLLEHRHEGMLRKGDLAAQSFVVETFGPAAGRDTVCGVLRDHLELGLGARQRCFHIQPCLQRCIVGPDRDRSWAEPMPGDKRREHADIHAVPQQNGCA
ncbi:hypothetical protein D3C87_1859520 [compost metagenome]